MGVTSDDAPVPYMHPTRWVLGFAYIPVPYASVYCRKRKKLDGWRLLPRLLLMLVEKQICPVPHHIISHTVPDALTEGEKSCPFPFL